MSRQSAQHFETVANNADTKDTSKETQAETHAGTNSNTSIESKVFDDVRAHNASAALCITTHQHLERVDMGTIHQTQLRYI
jgi:hypothetical protein